MGLIGQQPQQAIFLALPDALDMMVVCVEAGLGLDQAMRKVGRRNEADATAILAEEFALTEFPAADGPAAGPRRSTNWASAPACPTCAPWPPC